MMQSHSTLDLGSVTVRLLVRGERKHNLTDSSPIFTSELATEPCERKKEEESRCSSSFL